MSDYNAIRNTISLYCIALDNKDWTLLEKVFAKDVVAIYPFNDEPILGVDALSKRIQQRWVYSSRSYQNVQSFLDGWLDFRRPLQSWLSALISFERSFTDTYHRLKPVTTQHALTTQHLVVNATSANATTYFTGVHLGRGKWEGQLVTAYGKYVDELICVPAAQTHNAEIEAGASGLWKISKRTVTFFGRVGEEGVMEGEG
jgi:hypothetical protein